MFSGIGGFELGIQQATSNSWQCVGYSEIDKYAIQIYQKHFKEHINYGNATGIDTSELPDFDILVGGFPCQAFSIAGKKAGFNDTRGTLFFEIARILRDKRPRYFLLENVKGLLSHEEGKTFYTILGILSCLGYNIEWQVLNSKNFGVPQNRERVFIFGTREGSRSKIFPIGSNSKSDHVIPTLTARYYGGQANGAYLREISPKGNSQGMINNPLKNKTNYGWHFEQNVYSEDSLCRSLKSTEGSGNKPKIIVSRGRNDKQQLEARKDNVTNSLTSVQKDNYLSNGIQIRRLTPTECEILQGFPMNWTEGISDTRRYFCLGNAVTVNVIKAVIEKIVKTLTKKEKSCTINR